MIRRSVDCRPWCSTAVGGYERRRGYRFQPCSYTNVRTHTFLYNIMCARYNNNNSHSNNNNNIVVPVSRRHCNSCHGRLRNSQRRRRRWRFFHYITYIIICFFFFFPCRPTSKITVGVSPAVASSSQSFASEPSTHHRLYAQLLQCVYTRRIRLFRSPDQNKTLGGEDIYSS